MNAIPAGFQRYSAANSAQAAASLAEGVQVPPSLRRFALNGALSCTFLFTGVGAAGTTNTYRVWGTTTLYGADAQMAARDGAGAIQTLLVLHCLATVTATLGTATGVGSTNPILSSGENVAKTLVAALTDGSTTTPLGPGTDSETAFGDGTIGVYSPATAGGCAVLFLGNLARFDGLIVERTGGTATSGNAFLAPSDT